MRMTLVHSHVISQRLIKKTPSWDHKRKDEIRVRAKIGRENVTLSFCDFSNELTPMGGKLKSVFEMQHQCLKSLLQTCSDVLVNFRYTIFLHRAYLCWQLPNILHPLFDIPNPNSLSCITTAMQSITLSICCYWGPLFVSFGIKLYPKYHSLLSTNSFPRRRICIGSSRTFWICLLHTSFCVSFTCLTLTGWKKINKPGPHFYCSTSGMALVKRW